MMNFSYIRTELQSVESDLDAGTKNLGLRLTGHAANKIEKTYESL